MTSSKKKILFISEDVSLSQIVRLVQLGQILNPEKYEIHFACSQFPDYIFLNTSFKLWPIHTLGNSNMQKAIDKGKRLYDVAILDSYIAEELDLYDKIKPDLVISDFRLSVSISAPFYKIPFVTLINGYWSPNAIIKSFPIPNHPILKFTGEKVGKVFFPIAQPFVFYYFARPINILRKKFGLKAIGSLQDVLCYGDFVLYPDVPDLIPISILPSNHFFIGPTVWSPPGSLPKWSKEESLLPQIYVTMGSSGDIKVLPTLLAILEKMPVRTLVATADRVELTNFSSKIKLGKFLPGDEAAKDSSLVICNGGSSTAYQALKEGVPVLGFPTNIDQHLSMYFIKLAGAGLQINRSEGNPQTLGSKIEELLFNKKFKMNAAKIQESFHNYDSKELFPKVLERIFT